MGLCRTCAVVSDTMRISNSSKLVTLITENYGLVKVMAKGARRPQNPFGAALEPVTLVECIYYSKDSRDIQNISYADVIDDYTGIKSNLNKLAAGCCMVEMAQFYFSPGDTSREIFILLGDSLKALNNAEESDTGKHLWRYLLRFLDETGYKPSLKNCIRCGKKPKGQAVFLSFSEGGIICSCSDDRTGYGVRVSPGAILVMNELLNSDFSELHRIKIGKAQHAEVSRTALQFLAFHSGSSRIPKSLMFMEKIEKTERNI